MERPNGAESRRKRIEELEKELRAERFWGDQYREAFDAVMEMSSDLGNPAVESDRGLAHGLVAYVMEKVRAGRTPEENEYERRTVKAKEELEHAETQVRVVAAQVEDLRRQLGELRRVMNGEPEKEPRE